MKRNTEFFCLVKFNDQYENTDSIIIFDLICL